MTAKPDTLAQNLKRSLADETDAVRRRFANADRHSQADTATGNVIRSSFSFPPEDHALFDLLLQKAIAAGVATTKSALVRAGLHALVRMPSADLREALDQLVVLRPGPRPSAARDYR